MSVSRKVGYSGYGKNPTLYVRNVPESLTKEALETLFRPTAGFLQVRVVQHMRRMVFVDFESVAQATSAMDKYQGYCFPGMREAFPDDYELLRGLDGAS